MLLGIPVESGGRVSVEVAEESLRSMQESVQKLAAGVATQKENALAELSEDPTEKLQADLENMAVDDEVSRRLQRLENSKQLPSD